jgi:hypothetical protein
MRKALVPLLASLLLSGAATCGLLATPAQAQTEARPGTMVMAQNTATPPAMPGMGRPSAADMAARRQQRCQDGYAREVGRLAYLEARLGLNGSQQSLFSSWKAVRLDIAKRHADQCAQPRPAENSGEASPIDRMNRLEDQLKQRIADLDAERPAFASLYNGLTPDQRKMLMPRRHGMMGFARQGMGRGMMGGSMMRPGGGAMNPPPPPQ